VVYSIIRVEITQRFVMPLTPIASNSPVARLESGQPNSAAVLNVPAQGLLNQSLAISEDLEAIVAIQATIGTRITQLGDAIALRGSAQNLLNAVQSERSQTSAADTQATTIETGLAPLSSTTNVERDRVAGINAKLDGISANTYQPYSATLGAIAGAAVSASKYIYRDAAGAISFATPSTNSGTRMRDIVLQATLAPGAASPSIPNEIETSLPLIQTLNMASDRATWNATTRELTLLAGEYSIDGYVVAANAQLVEMLLVQGSTRYIGTSGKGTSEGGVIGSGANLSTYSHLMASFSISSSRVYVPMIYLSGGAIVASSLGEATPWAYLKIRHYQY
jgi:hypothetical protein